MESELYNKVKTDIIFLGGESGGVIQSLIVMD